jgi:hypothetical protein
MPGKSRKKGRYTPQVKKQGAAVNSTASVSQQAGTQVNTTAPVTKAPAAPPPAVKTGVPEASRVAPAMRSIVPLAMLKAAAIRYENVKKELATIGILAGVILIVLIIVAVTLS